MVKNLPAMQETWVRSLGQEDPLEKGMATLSSIFAWRIPWTEKPGQDAWWRPWGCKESDTTEKLTLWASMVAQMVKNLPAMLETWDPSLGQEYP